MRNFIALWCNGSTTDFGSVRAGSNPARVTNAIIFKLLAKKINIYRVLNVVYGDIYKGSELDSRDDCLALFRLMCYSVSLLINKKKSNSSSRTSYS